MTKADVVAEIANKTGIEKVAVQATVEAFMDSIKGSLETGNNVYLRGFGSFIVKKRAAKTGRNISKNTSISFVLPGKKRIFLYLMKVFGYFTLLEKQSKLPRYNMKCRGKHRTT